MQALLLSSSMIRLVVFLIGVVAVYFLWGNTRVILTIVVVEIALFLFLVSRHSRLKYKRDFLQEMIAINKTELQVLDREFYDLPDGDTFKNPMHEFSQDIDLFGRGSFFTKNPLRISPAKNQYSTTLPGTRSRYDSTKRTKEIPVNTLGSHCMILGTKLV